MSISSSKPSVYARLPRGWSWLADRTSAFCQVGRNTLWIDRRGMFWSGRIEYDDKTLLVVGQFRSPKSAAEATIEAYRSKILHRMLPARWKVFVLSAALVACAIVLWFATSGAW